MGVLNSSCTVLYWSITPTFEEFLPSDSIPGTHSSGKTAFGMFSELQYILVMNMDDCDVINKPPRMIKKCPLLLSQPVVKHYPASYMYMYDDSITSEYDQCVIASNNCDNILYIGQIWYMNVMNYHLWTLLVCVDVFLLSCLIL